MTRSKGRSLRVTAAAVACVLVVGLSPAGAAKRSRLADLKAKLQSLFSKIEHQKEVIGATVKEERRVVDQLNDSEARLDAAKADLETSRKKLAAARQAVAEAAVRLQAARDRLKEQQGRFGRRIAATYVQGPVTYVDVMLGSNDFNDFLDRQYLVERMMEQDATIVQSLRGAQREVAKEHNSLVSRQQAVTAVHVEIVAREQALEDRRKEQKQLLANINNRRELQEQQLEELEKDSQEIEWSLQAELRRRMALHRRYPRQYRALPSWTGRFSMPARGRITSRFGMRYHPIRRTHRMHTGVDIGAGYGAPIYAAASGEVWFSGLRGGYGKCIIILHGNGVQTLYGHCSSLNVRSGQNVRRGQLIGHVGSTGASTGPHLHFEVRRNGRPVNPL